MPKDYSDLQSDFNIKYLDFPNTTFEQVRRSSSKSNYVKSFLPNKIKTPERKEYLRDITHMFHFHVDVKTMPKYNFERDYGFSLKNVDFVQFMRDYEEVMAAKHREQEGSKRTRKPHEGTAIQTMDTIIKSVKAYNKPLVDVWADRIMREGFDLAKLQKETDKMHEKAIKFDGDLSRGNRRAVDPVVVMHAAMKKAISQRTWGQVLNIFNLGRILRENSYMKKLDAQVKLYEQKGVTLQNCLDRHTEPLVSDEQIQRLEQHKADRIAAFSAEMLNKNAESKKENAVTDNIKMPLNLGSVFEENSKDEKKAPQIESKEVQINGISLDNK